MSPKSTEIEMNGKGAKNRNISFFGNHMTTSVQICQFEASKLVHLRHLRVDFGIFADTKHKELPGAYSYDDGDDS